MERRTILKAALSTPIILASCDSGLATKQAANAPPFEPGNPLHVGLAYRKLGWCAEDKLTLHWINLTRYGMVDSKLTTMWDSIIGIMFTTKDITGTDGEYDVTSISLAFYLDPKTGEMMETYVNPWTGQKLDIPYGEGKPSTRRQKAVGMDIGMRSMPGMKSSASSSRQAWTEGGEVWVRGDLDIRMEAEGGGQAAASMGPGGSGGRAEAPTMTRLMQVNDWFTYHGNAVDVMDPAVKNPPSDLYFNDLNTWSGWLKMGDQPGNFIGRGFGRKVFAYADMPENWRKLMSARYPEIAKDPEKALRG